MNRRVSLQAVSTLGALWVAGAHAQSVLDDWEISGSNSLRYDYIGIHGDETASPYSIDGSHTYNEFNLNFSRNYSPFTSVTGQVSGVLNDSEYRHVDDGFVPERVILQLESGATAIPLKVDMGDFFSDVSYRTLQRSLKGAQLELQPTIGSGELQHSLLFFTGANQANWRDFDWSEDRFAGASWLMGGHWGQLTLNTVQNSREGVSYDGDLTQRVHSARYSQAMTLGSEQLNLEAEYAYLDGDTESSEEGGDKENQKDNSVYAEVSGRSSYLAALDYRLRYEDSGDEFRPRGGIISPNRQSQEAFVGWRHQGGLYFQGRYQFFEDNAEAGDSRDTDVWGLRMVGPMLGKLDPLLSGSLQAYRQELQSSSRAVDLDVDTLDFSLTRPLGETWKGELQGFWQQQDDAAETSRDQTIRQISLKGSRGFAWSGFSGSIAPGLTLRNVDSAGGDSDEIHPTVDVSLYKENHSFSVSYGWFDQDRSSSTAAFNDVTTQTARLNYSFQTGSHRLGVEGFWFDRGVRQFEDSENYKVGVFWTFSFDKPRRASRPGPTRERGQAPEGATSAPGQIQPPVLFGANLQDNSRLVQGLALGAPMAPQLGSASLASFGPPRDIGRSRIYHSPVLPQLTLQQQLVLSHDDSGALTNISLVIEAHSDGRIDRLSQNYARVRSALIQRFGNPTSVDEQGEFSHDLALQLFSGRFTRTIEWQGSESTIRFGIPSRSDGRIQLEVQEIPNASYEYRFQSALALR